MAQSQRILLKAMAGSRERSPIEISDNYSIVELPESLIDDVVWVMRKSLLRGKKAVVRRFVEKNRST